MIINLAAILVTAIIYLIHKKMGISYKKQVIIVIGIMILGVILFKLIVFINHKLVKKYTIEEITNVSFDDIVYVKENYAEISSIEFKNNYKNVMLRKEKYIDEKIDEKIDELLNRNVSFSAIAIREYKCYNKNKKLLFTMFIQSTKYYEINGKEYYVCYK